MRLNIFDNILVILYGICVALIITLIVIFSINYTDLTQFKTCYDNSFQDTKCQRYINY